MHDHHPWICVYQPMTLCDNVTMSHLEKVICPIILQTKHWDGVINVLLTTVHNSSIV